jgi:hypothetical protein
LRVDLRSRDMLIYPFFGPGPGDGRGVPATGPGPRVWASNDTGVSVRRQLWEGAADESKDSSVGIFVVDGGEEQGFALSPNFAVEVFFGQSGIGALYGFQQRF